MNILCSLRKRGGFKRDSEIGISILCFRRRPQHHCTIDCVRWKSQTMYISNLPWSYVYYTCYRIYHELQQQALLKLCTWFFLLSKFRKKTKRLMHAWPHRSPPPKKTSSSKPLNVLKFDSKEENSTPIIKDSTFTYLSGKDIYYKILDFFIISPGREHCHLCRKTLHRLTLCKVWLKSAQVVLEKKTTPKIFQYILLLFPLAKEIHMIPL